MKRVLVGIVVIALALGLVGCKSIQDKIGEEIGEGIVGAATDSDVEVNDDSVTIQTDDGEVTIANDTGEMPDGFPSDFPLYDDYVLDGASSVASGGTTTYYINMTSEDEVTEVFEWYKAEFDDGWTTTGDTFFTDSGSSSGMLTAEKGDMEATVSMTTENDGTTFGVILVVTD
ncbi:MAG: hypothetical protein Q7W51_00390 [Coriobacteriia bacterium]|nr:hypothetical protein [Coriobacteriia bacterium]